MAKRLPMTEDELAALLDDQQHDAATYYDSELASAQAEAMRRYYAQPYNDGSEVPNRSQVVTHDIEDTINWIMPAIIRTFANNDELLTVEDPGIDSSDERLQEVDEYLRHVFFKDNNGESIIHDYAFDALLQKIGIGRVDHEDPQPGILRRLEGVTLDQLSTYIDNDEYEIVSQEMIGGEGVVIDEDGNLILPPDAEEPTFNLEVRRNRKHGKTIVEVVPPENFRISRRAKSIDAADYHGMRIEEYTVELLRDYPEKAHLIDTDGTFTSITSFETEVDDDERVTERFPDETEVSFDTFDAEHRRAMSEAFVEYIRVDFDGDNTVELRRVKRVGNVILENEIVEESEFCPWSPIRVAHKAIGRSIADTLLDIQKIRTALLRRGLDSLARSLAPRSLVNKQAIAKDPTLYDRLLDHDIGDVIPVDGNPGDVYKELVTPDVSAYAFTALGYVDQLAEQASGVTRHNQGLRPEAITDTMGGIEKLQAAANARIELVAKWLSYGLQDIFTKILRTELRYQNAERQILVNGRRLMVDPRRWSEDMTVTVHVGMAAESRERRIIYLNDIKKTQEQILTTVGINNPLVTLNQYRNTLAMIVNTMGYRDATKFFQEVDQNWQPPEAGEDPHSLEVKAKAELQTAELQGKQQLQAAEFQSKQQLQVAELQHSQQLEQMKTTNSAEQARIEAELREETQRMRLESEQQIAAIKAENERAIAELKIAAERDLAYARLAQERELAEMRMTQERELADERNRLMVERRAVNGGAGGTGEDGGGEAFRPGGRLDA